jgi:DNA-binding transcriptional LysR family regulator
MDTLRGVESFVWAVSLGSIAAAARRLEISSAAASQNIARLEQELGTRLLNRTTRRLALTDSGEVYYQRVKGLVQELALAKEAVTAMRGDIRGKLTVAGSAAFARHVLSPLLPGFNRMHPQLSVELAATDRRIDHLKEGIDVSIRIRPQLEPGIVARRLATVPTLFCAAPDYLQKAGVPQSPEALRQHDCLVFRVPVDGRILPWGFIRDGQRFEPDVRATMISDDIDVLARLAVAGGGITRLASFVAEPYIASGQLKQIFHQDLVPEVEAVPEPLEYYLCMTDRHAQTPKVRALGDYLRQQLPPGWL